MAARRMDVLDKHVRESMDMPRGYRYIAEPLVDTKDD
jgi:hypothetical protein